MTGEIALYINLAFGKLELTDDKGGSPFEIPSWLIDRPDVLAALAAIAAAGGTNKLERAPDWHDVVVDLATGEVSFREGADQ